MLVAVVMVPVAITTALALVCMDASVEKRGERRTSYLSRCLGVSTTARKLKLPRP